MYWQRMGDKIGKETLANLATILRPGGLLLANDLLYEITDAPDECHRPH